MLSGQTTGAGPCGGTASAPIEVKSANVMSNGDFSGGLNGGGTAPAGWTVSSSGTDTRHAGGNPCGAVQINFLDGNAPYLPVDLLPYRSLALESGRGVNFCGTPTASSRQLRDRLIESRS